MADTQHYDILVLGSGEAGKYLAWTMAKAGRRVAVVERRLIGGSCPNIACLPSKNIIYSAHVAALVRRGAEFGIETGSVSIDMAAVRQRKRKMVDDLIAIHRNNYANSGAELIMGEGRFIGPKMLEARLADGGIRQLSGARVFLNVGTHAAIPDIPGLAEAQPLTHVEALELGHAPEHLIVLGGGYVGLEFAQPMRRFGSRVTVVEQGSQIASHEDGDVAQVLMQKFAEEGIDVMLNAKALEVEGRSGEKVRLRVQTAGGTQEIEGSDILVAAGRTPNTQDIGLDVAGVDLDARGYIKVNERLETTAPDVWALGAGAGEVIAVVQTAMLAGLPYTTLRDAILTHPTIAEGLTVLFANAPGAPAHSN